MTATTKVGRTAAVALVAALVFCSHARAETWRPILLDEEAAPRFYVDDESYIPGQPMLRTKQVMGKCMDHMSFGCDLVVDRVFDCKNRTMAVTRAQARARVNGRTITNDSGDIDPKFEAPADGTTAEDILYFFCGMP